MWTKGGTVEPKFLDGFKNMKAASRQQLVYTKTVDSVEAALWLASQTPNILCYGIYLWATQEKMASRFASVTSEEIIQINFLWCIFNNYSLIQVEVASGGYLPSHEALR